LQDRYFPVLQCVDYQWFMKVAQISLFRTKINLPQKF
jgi:hypothetical protein